MPKAPLPKDRPVLSNLAPALRGYVDRIENLNVEKKETTDAINDIYRECKSNGLDPKVIREMIKLRKQNPGVRAAQEFNRDAYMRALGLADDLA